MNDIDTTGWETLVETPHGTVYFADKDIIVTIPKPGAQHDEKVSAQQLDRLHQMIKVRGRKCGYIIVVDPVVNQSAGARTQWQTEMDPTLVFGMGLVASTELAKRIGQFFEGTNEAAVPLRVSDSFSEILTWLQTRREAYGGAI